MHRRSRQHLASGLSLAVALIAGALASTGARTATAATPPSGRVVGAVYDSVGRAPLANALVQLVPLEAGRETRAARTDATGAFEISDVEPGRYALGFFHQVLDSLFVELPPRIITVSSDATVRTQLAVPAPATIRTRVCGPRARADSTGLLIGQLFDAATGVPIGDGTVAVEWSQLVLAEKQLRHETPAVRVHSDESGRFAICSLPIDGELLASASRGVDSTGSIVVQIPPSGMLRHDFFLGRSAPGVVAAMPTSTTDTTEATVIRHGFARLSGSVRDATQRPIAGANIRVWGSGAEQTTGERGEFTLVDLPAGTQLIEVRALGFEPRRFPVNLTDAQTTTLDVALTTAVRALDTVRVLENRYNPARMAFEHRREIGRGYFFDAEYLRRRQTFYTTDVLRDVPGMKVTRFKGQNMTYMRKTDGNYCAPLVFVDGLRMPGIAHDMDNFVRAEDVVGIEVYTQGTRVPIEFMNDLDNCGSVALWTTRSWKGK